MLVSVAAIISGCAIGSRQDVGRSKLKVRTFIDGADVLFVRGDQIWFKHYAYDLPGKWRKVNEPSYVNGSEWMPEWKDSLSDRFTIPSDSVAALPPNKEFDETTLEVNSYGAWGKVSVVEYPNAGNDFTLVVLLDDLEYEGASWYNIGIDWED